MPNEELLDASVLIVVAGMEGALPSVLGGLVATVGDTVIDGTVRTRIEQLKSRL